MTHNRSTRNSKFQYLRLWRAVYSQTMVRGKKTIKMSDIQRALKLLTPIEMEDTLYYVSKSFCRLVVQEAKIKSTRSSPSSSSSSSAASSPTAKKLVAKGRRRLLARSSSSSSAASSEASVGKDEFVEQLQRVRDDLAKTYRRQKALLQEAFVRQQAVKKLQDLEARKAAVQARVQRALRRYAQAVREEKERAARVDEDFEASVERLMALDPSEPVIDAIDHDKEAAQEVYTLDGTSLSATREISDGSFGFLMTHVKEAAQEVSTLDGTSLSSTREISDGSFGFFVTQVKN